MAATLPAIASRYSGDRRNHAGRAFGSTARRRQLAVIEELQQDARLSLAALGRGSGSPRPPSASALGRLEESGVIRGYHADVDPGALGLALTSCCGSGRPRAMITRSPSWPADARGDRVPSRHRRRLLLMRGTCGTCSTSRSSSTASSSTARRRPRSSSRAGPRARPGGRVACAVVSPTRSAGRATTSPASCPVAGCCSRRAGGGLEGPYESLNLGRLTDDDGANIDANRERLAAAVGLPRERFIYGRQVHGAHVRRATGPMGPAARGEEDGQATALPASPRSSSSRIASPSCSPPEAPWPRCTAAGAGLRPGSSPRASPRCASPAAKARRPPRSGPAPAPAATRSERRSTRLRAVPGARVGERNLDLPRSRARAGGRRRRQVHDTGLCTICDERFFSHRRDGG